MWLNKARKLISCKSKAISWVVLFSRISADFLRDKSQAGNVMRLRSFVTVRSRQQTLKTMIVESSSKHNMHWRGRATHRSFVILLSYYRDCLSFFKTTTLLFRCTLVYLRCGRTMAYYPSHEMKNVKLMSSFSEDVWLNRSTTCKYRRIFSV